MHCDTCDTQEEKGSDHSTRAKKFFLMDLYFYETLDSENSVCFKCHNRSSQRARHVYDSNAYEKCAADRLGGNVRKTEKCGKGGRCTVRFCNGPVETRATTEEFQRAYPQFLPPDFSPQANLKDSVSTSLLWFTVGVLLL